jgi:hypothetical protein
MSGGLGEDDLIDEYQGKPDFNRGAGGEPMVARADGSGKQDRYARTSSLGDTLDEKSGLHNWLTSKAMEGLGRQPELVAEVIAVTPYEDHKPEWTTLREKAINAGRGSWKADMGTAVHAMSERWEREPEWDPGEPYSTVLGAYSATMERLGLRSQLFEAHIVNDVLKVAGTTDRIYELTKPLLTPSGDVLPPGTLVIGDIKTGASLEYSIAGYAVQLAGYAGGTLYDVEANRRLPTPTIHQRWAIIMHLGVDDGHCEFLWVDLEVGRYGAQLSNEVREWRRAWRRKEGYKAGIQEVTVAEGDDFIVSEDPDEPDEGNLLDVSAWRQYCRTRLDAIRANDEAREWMLIRWPDTLMPPKRLETLDQAEALSAFLDRVEAEFGLPFVEGQPRGPKVKGSAA